MLNFLSDNLAIGALLLVTLLVLLFLALIVSAALRGAGAPAAADKLRLLGAESLRQSFRSAVELIEANLAARAERYRLSWTLLLDDGAEGELALADSGLPSALSADSTLDAAAQGIRWHFFDSGVVVQLQNARLGPSDPDSVASGGVWDDFLGLCRRYRPQRPFDSIVLALPCSAFFGADGQEQLDLVARAKAIHRRLWLAQNRLALRFPIYLVVSGCDALPGFATFGAALPEPLRRSMLGWSAPYELVAPFRAQWVDSAMDEIVRTAAERCAELAALEPAGQDSSAYFMLPGELERLRSGVKLFCDELMRPSAYHEPFLLRGIYLTGDSSARAALVADSAAAAVRSGGAAAPDAGVEVARMPVFLRDVFERKVFAEAGLVQSSSQRLRRPAASRVGHWAMLALPALWAVGLVAATLRLHYLGDELRASLAALNTDARASLREAAAGGPAQRSQQRATDALLNIERLGEARFSSPFMPGSWPLFDDLHRRVLARLERGFAENAFDPLRRAAFSRVSGLTGVALEPTGGALIGGATCRLPAGWAEQAAAPAGAALNLEDLPHFAATLGYLARIEELDRVMAAMLRLKDPHAGPASGADLRLVVRVLLGAELDGNPARTAALFRAVAAREPSLALQPVQAAARCSLRLAAEAMYARLFDGNGLLRAEAALDAAAGVLAAGSQPGLPLAERLRPWQAMRAALDTQQGLAASGKGGWMRLPGLELGAAHDAMLARIGANGLLGKAAALETRRIADDGFARFRQAWHTAAGASSAGAPAAGAPAAEAAAGDALPGLAWRDTAWTFSAERKALHAALVAMLGQAWMHAGAAPALRPMAMGETAGWDRTLLEQALHLAEARKQFQAGPYGQLPARLQPAARELADLALAETAHALLGQALTVAPVELPSGASDDARGLVLRVRGWLQEIGAARVVAELDGVLVRDALTRLQRLDDLFRAAEVYVPRDAGFQQWRGNKGALAETFAGGDPSALGAYLAQQQEFVDTVANQAEHVLAQLSRLAAGSPLVARWQAIVADLRRYRLKSPSSSLMALEQFIVGTGAEIDLGNCAEKLGTAAGRARGGDVFAERLQALKSGLLARCRQLSAQGLRQEWERFAELYNRDLARRPPFAARAGAHAVPADRETVAAAMKQYDRAQAAATLAEREATLDPVLRQAAEQLRPMRDLLAALSPAEAGQPAGLDVTVQFRAPGPGEAEANLIIDWSLAIGGATVRRNDTPRALSWEPGMPVVLSLRLARDGGALPRAEPGNGALAVADRTVSYRFDDPWALFSFIGAHRDGGEPRAPLLRFEFPVQHGVAGAASLTRARVFLRLSVSPSGKRGALAWPGSLPARLPGWQDALALGDAQPASTQLEASTR